jgi:hypothetical protein
MREVQTVHGYKEDVKVQSSTWSRQMGSHSNMEQIGAVMCQEISKLQANYAVDVTEVMEKK